MNTSTYFLLLEEFGTAIIPLKDISKKYFNLDPKVAKSKARKRLLNVPVFNLTSSQKAPYFIMAEDLAEFIDKQKEIQTNIINAIPPGKIIMPIKKLRKAHNCMKQRCYNKSNSGYKNYGGRGIKICDRWLNSVANFIHDMKYGDNENQSIDRIDNDGNYSPDNCRWATQKEQTNNSRRNIKLTYLNKTQNLSQWADDFGLSRSTVSDVYKRLDGNAALIIAHLMKLADNQ